MYCRPFAQTVHYGQGPQKAHVIKEEQFASIIDSLVYNGQQFQAI